MEWTEELYVENVALVSSSSLPSVSRVRVSGMFCLSFIYLSILFWVFEYVHVLSLAI